MFFKVQKDIFLEKLQLVANILPQRTTLVVLGNVKINAQKKAITLSTTDLDISLDTTFTADVKEPGSTTVPGKRLLETVRDLPPCELEIKIIDDFVELRYDRGVFKMPAIPVDEYPEIPEITTEKHFSFPSNFLKNSVQKTAFAVSKEPGRRALSGIHWNISQNEANMVATDGRKLALYKCSIKNKENIKVNIPPKALKTLINYIGDDETNIDIKFDETKIGFYLKDTTIIARLIEEVFPDYTQVIPKDNNKILSISRTELLDALKRVSIYSDSTSHLVSLEINPESVKVFTETELGSGEEHLKATFSDEKMTINFNASYLSEILRNIDEDTVSFNIGTPKTAVIITQQEKKKEELIYLLMPIITS